MTANNDKINSNEPVKEMEVSNNNTNNEPVKDVRQGEVIEVNSSNGQEPVQQQEQQPMPDLNDVVMDLKTLSNMCAKKALECIDLSSALRQIQQVTDNLALSTSFVLQSRGELDPKRFQLKQ